MRRHVPSILPETDRQFVLIAILGYGVTYNSVAVPFTPLVSRYITI